MIKTYFRLAFRGLWRHKMFSLVNVLGLAIGLTSCLLISMYLYQEFSYDSNQQYSDRLFQVGTVSIDGGQETRSSVTPAPLAPAMQREYPEVTSTTRLMKLLEDDKTLIQYSDNKDLRSFYETQGYMADSNFFQLFTYKFKEGNPATALSDPTGVVICDEIARKLFGNELALNKVVHINSNTNGSFDFKVTGVFVPSKTPSHIDARFFMSLQGGEVGSWVRQLTDLVNNNLFFTYLLLKPGADERKLESKFDAFIAKYAAADLKASGRQRKQFLTAVRDIHLYADTKANVTPPGSLSYLYILIAIAFVTLLIACVNFMNLSTARSSKRAVEIGVRKVLGAEKTSLVRQFLFEAVLLALISFVISIGLAWWLVPLFEKISGKAFSFTAPQYQNLFFGFLLVTITAGLVAGIYPALYLSAFKPVKVLKGRFTNSLGAVSLRKLLVVFQFVISVALIVASITISRQMSYLRTKDLGFQKDQQVVIPLRTSTAKNIYPALENEFQNNPAVSFAGASNYYPGIPNVTDWLMYKQGNSPDQTRTVFMNRIDDSYLQTLGVQPVAGRLFSKDFPADTNNHVVLNEEAIRQFGFASAEDAIGKNIAATRGGTEMLWQIVGVVKDFHFKDLHTNIESYGFLLNTRPDYNYMLVHLKGGDLKSTLAQMSVGWSKLNPNEPFEYSFLDQDFEKNYFAEDRLATMIRYFTIIAIFISCLGLFGLTTFTVEQRTKEIGIRKVLGASATGLIGLLSKDFMKLVLISFFVASPLAWYFINKWLQGFAYRVDFTIWILLTAWGIALLIAFLTISIQAARVAFSNPARNLRIE